eukprot:TRINITY_DN72262_c0_g1_i1.p1 TRINITY_DN72262_c0_g1~~TRINITY_DN72262_c0_g1_i1.p1  ORF type:complete len:465 (+),score=86.05 TRINITY_DN72262_c0_g1_i1:52-1446(+)
MQRLQTAFCKDALLAARRSVSSRVVPKYSDLRELKQEQIAVARERVFGPQDNMPGDRQFHKRLEGRKLMRWYFPSKYNLQDFRTDDYFEMQAERFAPREEHQSIPQLVKMLQQIVNHREELRAFFKTMDEATFLSNSTLQDLYGLFRLLDPDHALPFQPPESVFLDHTPFGGIKPLLRLVSKGPSDEFEWDEVELEQAAKFIELQKVLPKDKFNALKARVSRLASKEEVCAMIEAQEKDHFITPLNNCTYVFETSNDMQSSSPDISNAEKPSVVVETEAASVSEPPAETMHEEAHMESADSVDETETASQSESPAENMHDEAHMKSAGASSQAPSIEDTGDLRQQAPRDDMRRKKHKLAHYPVEQSLGGSKTTRAKEMAKAEGELEKLKSKGKPDIRNYLSRRHRFIDPMYRRRRLKWLERQMSDLNREKDVKFSSYYGPHPDATPEWPTNKGSTTVVWPSPYH